MDFLNNTSNFLKNYLLFLSNIKNFHIKDKLKLKIQMFLRKSLNFNY
jgi:hypothetical protein